jgi:hypothetical protein
MFLSFIRLEILALPLINSSQKSKFDVTVEVVKSTKEGKI